MEPQIRSLGLTILKKMDKLNDNFIRRGVDVNKWMGYRVEREWKREKKREMGSFEPVDD